MDVRQILKQYRIRNTTARRQILSAILALEDRHFYAEDIIKYLRYRQRTTSRASTFRTIQLFCELGIVRVIELSKYGAKYECAIGGHHHDHLYCIRCGAAIEFKEEAIEKLQEKICRFKHFQPLSHILKITGVCKKCSISRK